MINIKFSNQAASSLLEDITATDTTIIIKETDTAKFPLLDVNDSFFMICLTNATDLEIVKVIAANNNTFTVVRAQEGTPAKAFPVGTSVENRLTAGSLRSIIENASETVPHATEDSSIIGQASSTKFGHVKIVDDDKNEATSDLGIAISPYAVKTAFNNILGAKTETIISSSTSWTVPVTGTYTVTAIGGGGSGGKSGFSVKGGVRDDCCCGSTSSIGGGGGGGGGAGQVKTSSIPLTAGSIVNIIIGGPSSSTTFGSYLTALGGGAGGAGGNAGGYIYYWGGTIPYVDTKYGGTGGAAGISYGSTATAGGTGSTPVGGDGCIHHIAYGGTGGIGGLTTHSPYGNGGNGAKSPDRPGTINSVVQWGVSYGSTGVPGTQGCVKIKLNVG